MRPSRIVAIAGLTALPLVPVGATLGLAAPALAAAPLIERIEIDEQFVDEDLSAACGFTVTLSLQGHLTIRSYDRETGLVEGATINITGVLSGPGGDYVSRDVGADQLRVTPDGGLILTIVGQAPFDFTGALKIDRIAREVILEPQHSTVGDLDEACAAIAG